MTFTEFSDLIKIGLFLAACFFSRQAVFVLFIHSLNIGIFQISGHDPIVYFCAIATLYAIACNADIKLLSEIRYVFMVFAVINWVSAIDYLMSPYQTMYGICYPWLVNGFDVLILYFLFRHRGMEIDWRNNGDSRIHNTEQIAVVHDYNLRLAALYLLQRFKKQDPK
jgi:hypothetical protein